MKEFDKFIHIKSNDLEPAKGRILLSEPFMGDFYFGRSVILLTEHNKDGTFGLIMNKPVTTAFNSVMNDFPKFEAPIYLGGPVETTSLFYIHTLGDQLDGALEIMEGLFWGGDIEALREMILLKKAEPKDIRFFVGYSGWGSNQLADELKRNSWVITKTTRENLLNSNPLMMWENLLTEMGDHYAYWKKFPVDPNMN